MVYLYPGARVWLYGLYNGGLVQGIELMGSGMGQRFRGLWVEGSGTGGSRDSASQGLQAKLLDEDLLSYQLQAYRLLEHITCFAWAVARLPKGSVNKKKVVRRGIKNGKEVWTGTALLKGTEPLCCKAR